MALIELVYVSAASTSFTRPGLMALMEKARLRNREQNVTGVLLHDDGSFLQVLEGEESVVSATFEKIAADSRHGKVQVLSRRPIEQRTFGDWSMGVLWVDQHAGRELGLNRYMRTGYTGGGLGSALVARVLNAFRDGNYRRAAA